MGSNPVAVTKECVDLAVLSSWLVSPLGILVKWVGLAYPEATWLPKKIRPNEATRFYNLEEQWSELNQVFFVDYCQLIILIFMSILLNLLVM